MCPGFLDHYNPYVRDLNAITFQDVFAIATLDENNNAVKWKTFDTFAEANKYAAKDDGTRKAWINGISNGESAIVFRTATYAQREFVFAAQPWRVDSLTHVENAARVIVHEGMHNKGYGHTLKLYMSEMEAVNFIRNKAE